jgi:hypothetical protein
MAGLWMAAVPLGDKMARPSPGFLDCAAWLALPGCPPPACLGAPAGRRSKLQGIRHFEEREAVKVGIPGHDPVDAMFPHQNRRMDIVEHVAR